MSLRDTTRWSKIVGRELWTRTRRIRKRRPSRARFRLAVDLLESRALLSTLTVTNTDDSGPGSLRDAIAIADSLTSATKIVFAPTVSGTIDLASGPLTITNNLDIDGPGAGKLAVSGQGVSRVFVIDGGSYGGASQVSIGGLTIEDGLATSDLDFPASGGGILDLMAGLTLDDCVLDSNQAPWSGAGTMIYRGSLAASDSTWSNNSVFAYSSPSTVGSDTIDAGGLGIAVFAGAASIDQCEFATNTWVLPATNASGGGIFVESGSTLTVSRSEFDGNRVAEDGGGITASDTDLTVLTSSFDSNESQVTGGAITVEKSRLASTPQLIVKSSSFVANQSGYSGGAICTIGATSDLTDSLFSANQVSGFSLVNLDQGGAIAALSSVLQSDQSLPLGIARCTFVDNQAVLPGGIAQGGAIWNEIAMTVKGGIFSGNSAEGLTAQGGAIANAAGTAVTIAHSSFEGNQAVGQSNGGDGGANGGAIYTDLLDFSFPSLPTTTDITATSFTNNMAVGQGLQAAGGAIADAPVALSVSGMSLEISNSTFSGNQAVESLDGSPSMCSVAQCTAR